ncbi:diguanylate cyclase [Eubacteriales bacterium OttesenSCG-928-M02]|nr:diguanylate cyclase [Eubacteriales bacterium OttesenSCG-928-M02]
MSKNKERYISLSARVSIIVSVMLLLAALITGMVGYFLYRNASLVYNQNTVIAVAQAVSSQIDAEEYQRLIDTAGETPYWHQLKSLFDIIKTNTGVKYLYALNNDVDGNIMFIVEGQTQADDPALICTYRQVLPVGSYTPELFQALNTGQSTAAGAHQVPVYGTMVSGYCPIWDGDGNIIGVVGADLDINLVLSQITQFGFSIIGLSLLIAAIASGILVFYLRRNLDRPIQALIKASHQAIEAELLDGADSIQVDSQDEIGRLSASVRDVIQKAKPQDILTQTHDRRVGIRALEQAIEAADRGISSCAAFIDVDGLKSINDVYGHVEGDYALKSLADALLSSVREEDVVCRYGGDEFLIVFTRCTKSACQDAILRMEERLAQAGLPYPLSFSAGLIEIPPGQKQTTQELIQEMDQRMYENKRKKQK